MRFQKFTKHALMGGIAGILACPTAVFAQDSADSGSGGDIIVTARRTEERLQDVPISITVFSQDQIDKRNIVSASDLATYTPSLSVNQKYGAEKSSFAIRGFVQDQATAPSVGVYFADVPMPLQYGATTAGGAAPIGSLMDLQNVQVLKGPQGTLFGRNTTGGAVLLVPKKPTDRFEGYVEGSAGDYGLIRGQGVLNIPLADTFKVRLSVDRQKRDGYMKNHSNIGPDAYNDINYFYARLGIVADLTPDLENYTLAYYSHSFGDGYGARLQKVNPAFATAPIARAAQAQIDRDKIIAPGPWDVDINNPDPFVQLHQWSVINTTTWKASDTLTVKNIASYTQFRERSNFQLYSDDLTVPAGLPGAGTPIRVTNLDTVPGRDTTSAQDFTEELQIQGRTSDDRLNWQAGGYLERSSPLDWGMTAAATQLNCIDASVLNCTNPLYVDSATFRGSISNSRSKHFFHSTGLYAQATYKLSDKFSVTGGIRYTWDSVHLVAEMTRVRFPAGLPPYRICNDAFRYPKSAGPAYPDDTDTTKGAGGKLVTDVSQCHVELTNSSHKPTWLIEGDFKPSDEIMIYAKWARGYRAGGINPTNVGIEKWFPETVDTYELGAKTTFRGAVSGYFNIAGFYNDFRNQQVGGSAIPDPRSGLGGAAAIVNAGKSRIYGAELDASATFFDSLRFDVGYTYLNTRVVKITPPVLPPFPQSPFTMISLGSFEGDPLALSPEHRVALTGAYTLPLDENVGKVSFGATYVYTAEQLLSRASAPEFQFLPASNLVNLNLDWSDVMKLPVDVSVFVTNVTNEAVVVGTGGGYNSPTTAFETQLYAAPRMWGARLRYKFGS